MYYWFKEGDNEKLYVISDDSEKVYIVEDGIAELQKMKKYQFMKFKPFVTLVKKTEELSVKVKE